MPSLDKKRLAVAIETTRRRRAESGEPMNDDITVDDAEEERILREHFKGATIMFHLWKLAGKPPLS